MISKKESFFLFKKKIKRHNSFFIVLVTIGGEIGTVCMCVHVWVKPTDLHDRTRIVTRLESVLGSILLQELELFGVERASTL